MDVIIGAGVSGISYANFSHNPYLLLESEKEIGGYCRTIKRNGFVWDYSGHFFHFRNPDIKEFVCKNIQVSQLVETQKHTQIYYKGQYIDFPFQSNIHQLPQQEFIDCLYDLFTADSSAVSNTFKEFIYNNLGKSISEKFLVPYNEKLYATDLNHLDAGAMGRFFPKVDKEAIIRNFRDNKNESYNDIFAYPKGGAIEYIHSLMHNIGYENLKLNSRVIQIDRLNKYVVLQDGQRIRYDHLISTMPFPKLLEMCAIDFDRTIYSSNKVLVFNLGFDKESLDKINSWVYFPDKDLSFYRVGYYNNIISNDKMSLYVEIGFKENEIIPATDDLLVKVLSDLRKTGIIADHQLTDYQAVLMDPAYVHINKRHLADIAFKKKMLQQNDIYSIGRYGSWTYCSIEDNIIEAKELVVLLNK